MPGRRAAGRCGQLAAAGGHRPDGVPRSRRRRHLAAAERLAAACLAAGRADEAIDAYGEVLSRRERLLGAGHPDAFRARALLASALGAAGQMSAALRHYQQAYAGYRRALGAGHRETLACSAGLARAYAASGQMTAAMSLLAAAISAGGAGAAAR